MALTTNGSTGIPVWHELVAGLREMGLPIGDYHGVRDVKGSLDGEPSGELTSYDELVFTIRDTETGESDQTGRFMRDTRLGRVDWIQVGGRLARRRGYAYVGYPMLLAVAGRLGVRALSPA